MVLTVPLRSLVAELVSHCQIINCQVLQLAACPSQGFGKLGEGQLVVK